MQHDIVCFLHLRWNFVYQRPQHLLSRFAKNGRVFIVEEPIFDAELPYHQIEKDNDSGVFVITPHLIHGSDVSSQTEVQRQLLSQLFQSKQIENYILWYYSPMALMFTGHLQAKAVIYDCMDELSAFKFAPVELKEHESWLFNKADIVFTGGHHLYEAKKDYHHNIYPVPSSIDKNHFLKARQLEKDPGDQESIPHPRLGFYGVIDERFNLSLLESLADLKPEWNFVMIGPVVKIDIAALPQRENIHYLGPKDYQKLPAYLAGWDIAVMPFALNESTKYISPTKTPEFLAAGKPVISTSIRDVVVPYGIERLVYIADTPDEFAASAEYILANEDNSNWLNKVDNFLENISWDNTWTFMNEKIKETVAKKNNILNHKKSELYV